MRGAILFVLLVTSAGCSSSTWCALGGSCPTTASASPASTSAPLPKMRPRDVARHHYVSCVRTSDGSDCR